MTHNIHKKSQDKLADNSERMVGTLEKQGHELIGINTALADLKSMAKDKSSTVQDFKDVINALDTTSENLVSLRDFVDNPEFLIRKLEEIKSASKISNDHLKKISQKKLPEVLKLEIPGVKLATIKGKQGNKGEDGKDGRDGQDGKSGLDGDKGIDGRDGRDGVDGVSGSDGEKGQDGSPDNPAQVIEKVNKSKKRIKASRIEGLAQVIREVEQFGTFPTGIGNYNAKIKNSGTLVSDLVTEIDFSTGITAVYSNDGKVTITAGSSSDTPVDEVLTDTGDRITWTITSTPASVIAVHFQRLHMAGGGTDYSHTAGSTSIVFNAALSGTSIPIITYIKA